MTQFRGAVIGCGRMGAFTSDVMRRHAPPVWLPLSHGEAMAAHSKISLAALCDIDGEALRRAQERFGVTKGYADYRRLVDEVAPQIVGIATRTAQRAEIIHYAIDRGVLALHIEKPLCNGVGELIRIERRLATEPVFCTYGTLRRYFPIYQHARELARSGRYGVLQQVQVCFGVGRLLWTHPHSLDLLLFFAGDVEPDWAIARFAEDGFTVEGSTIDGDPVVTAATLQFSNGVTGLISQTGGWDVVLACSEGSITVESDGRRIRCRNAHGDDPYWSESYVDELPGAGVAGSGGTKLALDRLVNGLLGFGANQAEIDKQAMLSGQRLLFACAQSHLAGGKAINPRQLDAELSITGHSAGRYA